MPGKSMLVVVFQELVQKPARGASHKLLRLLRERLAAATLPVVADIPSNTNLLCHIMVTLARSRPSSQSARLERAQDASGIAFFADITRPPRYVAEEITLDRTSGIGTRTINRVERWQNCTFSIMKIGDRNIYSSLSHTVTRNIPYTDVDPP